MKRPDSSEKGLILLEFTLELLRHSFQGEVYNLKKILQGESAQRQVKLEKNRVFASLPAEEEIPKKSTVSFNHRERPIDFKDFSVENRNEMTRDIFPRKKRRVIEYINPLVIPKTQLPPRFQYLKPTPTKLEIDLGKLNPLVSDPLVGEIECSGANQNIIVVGTMGKKKTNIFLSREEIEDVINKFSEVSKIPVQEGVFKVVAGNYIFSAVVSNLITSRFIIKKINYNPSFRRR